MVTIPTTITVVRRVEVIRVDCYTWVLVKQFCNLFVYKPIVNAF